MESTTPIIHDRSDYLKVVFGKGASVPCSLYTTNSEGDRRSPDEFGNTTFLINPKIHFHSDNSMIIMDISGEEYKPGKGLKASSLLTLKVALSEEFEHTNTIVSTIDISGQYIHSYHDICGQHIHTYPDSSGLHIHTYTDNSGLYIHPYHDVSGWHLPSYRDVSSVTYGWHIYPYHDAWGWHMLPSDLSTNDISRNLPNFPGGRATLPRDIGWHIHPYDGSDNIIHDASGWHFKPPPIRAITVLHVKTIDASLNWYYFHHGHPIDLSMTDTSEIHHDVSTPTSLPTSLPNPPDLRSYGFASKSIHIHQYDYPYPSSTLFPVTHDHHNSVSEYFNEFIFDIHKIMAREDASTPFEFPIDFIPDVSIPPNFSGGFATFEVSSEEACSPLPLCTYTNVSTTIIDISGNEFIHIVDTITDVSGNQTTCDISASVTDISGNEFIHIVDTITDVSGNQTICDISASVIDISGSEPILIVDITDISGNQSSYDISATNVERDTSGILQSSTYTIDCSTKLLPSHSVTYEVSSAEVESLLTNSIHVTLSDFGNNLPPYVVYICDVCAKAKLSTQ